MSFPLSFTDISRAPPTSVVSVTYKVIVLFQDGDDGTFAYVVFNNRIKVVRDPIYKKFIEMLGVDYVTNF